MEKMPVMQPESEPIRHISPNGRLTLDRAAAFKEELLAAFEQSRKVQLDLARVEDADLTLVQIVYAARREAVQAGCSFELTGKLPDRIVKLLVTGGFLKAGINDAAELEANLHNYPREA
jgi:anti-anti-sigma regulatory factor